jgi:hypothetical protein
MFWVAENVGIEKGKDRVALSLKSAKIKQQCKAPAHLHVVVHSQKEDQISNADRRGECVFFRSTLQMWMLLRPVEDRDQLLFIKST